MSFVGSRRFIEVLAISVLVATGCAKKQSDPRTLPEIVRATTVRSAEGSESAFTGVVTARVQSDLGFRVGGKVTQRLVDTGQKVRAGQVLMKIDRTDFANEVLSRNETVSAAEARAKQTAADEARYRGLVATGAISASTYDQIKATADAAAADLAAAKAQSSITQDQGNYTLLLADADGVIVQTLAEPGQVVSAGQTVVRLAHTGPREAAVNLPETVRPKIGSTALVELYGDSQQGYAARLRQLSDSSDSLTRTFEARYVLQGGASSAPLGSTVTVILRDRLHADNDRVVPLSAITDRGKGSGVWVLSSDDRVSLQSVRVASLSNEEATLSDGPAAGTKIVAMGAHLLSQGQQVRVEAQAMDAK